MSEQVTLRDALGQEVKVGSPYGYTYFWGGLATTAIGVVDSLDSKFVDMSITCRTYFLNGEILEQKWVDRAPKNVRVAPHVLFPVV
jgi:hypothetical protein